MKIRKFFSAAALLLAMAASAQGGYQDGVDYYNADRFPQARIILEKNLGSLSGNDKAVAYYYLGAIDLRENHPGDAEKDFNNGIAADPNEPLNYIGLGEISLASNPKQAKDLFEQAMKLDKKNPDVSAAIARAYFNVDPVTYSKEIDKYVKQSFKDSDNMGSAVNILLGDMNKANNVGMAAGYYEQAMRPDANGNYNPESYVKYANLYNKVNNEYSIAKLQELKSLMPTSALAQRELAEKYYDSELYSKAAAEYKEYMNNPNHFQQDEQRYSQLLFFDNKNQESLNIAKNVLSNDPSNFYMYRMVLLNDAALGNLAEAEEYGRKLFAAPGAVLTNNDYNTFGKVLADAGKPAEAVAIYEQAFNADPQKFQGMLVNISDLYTELGDFAKATEYLQKYVDLGSGNLNDLFSLGKLYGALAQTLGEGTPERADAIAKGVGALDRALETAATKAPLLRTKGQILGLRDGNDISADQADTYKAMLDAYAEENPEAATTNPGPFKQAYSVLGAYNKKIGNEAESVVWFEKLYELDPTIPGLKEMLKK